MNTYVAVIGGTAVLTFRAVDDDQAHAMIDDQEGSVRSVRHTWRRSYQVE
jgi:hypothetical protein